MQKSIFTVGLTGGIASGKSTVADLFSQQGIAIIDADQIAKSIVAPGSDVLQEIIQHFGQDILDNEQQLNRSALRSIIFNDDGQRLWLENLLHPIIRQQMFEQRQSASSPYCLFVVPLLIEKQHDFDIQRLLVIDCPLLLQIQRATARDNATEQQIQRIVDSQASPAQRLAEADDIIVNDSDCPQLEQQVLRLHQQYLHLSQ